MSSHGNISGSWKTSTYKKYNFEAEGTPTAGGALHPLLKVREEIRNIFLEMGSVHVVYCEILLLTNLVLRRCLPLRS